MLYVDGREFRLFGLAAPMRFEPASGTVETLRVSPLGGPGSGESVARLASAQTGAPALEEFARVDQSPELPSGIT